MHQVPRGSLIAGILIAFVLSSQPIHAQYTADFQTNIISGVTSNWTGNYYVGNGMIFDQLQLINGGVLSVSSNVYTDIGNGSTATSNSVLVSGTGSIWSNRSSAGLYIGFLSDGNWMTITNGGAVYCSFGSVGAVSDYNAVLVMGSNSVWGVSGDMWMRGKSNSMTIAKGGGVYNNGGGVGIDGDYDVMVVNGSGSVWSNNGYVSVGDVGHFNFLIITNGGAVYGGGCHVGQSQLLPTSSASNVALVTGSGSIWSNSGNFDVGLWSADNSVTITDGGVLYNADSYIGTASGSNNLVAVNGNGAIWQNKGDLHLGWFGGSSFNQLTIGTGGSVLAQNAYVGSDSGTVGNRVTISGGNLYVTNALGNGEINVCGGMLTFSNGTVTVNQLVLTNGANSVLTFSGGVLNSGGASVTNGQSIVVGDGVHAANYHLQGGAHSFANGLRIRANAMLSGCGTISGSVVVDAGGSVVADCGGILTFTGVITNNGTMRAVNGTTMEFFGPAVNTGLIDVINGSTNFHSTFINHGILLDATGDWDGDGMSNLQEYQAGTDPTNSASAFRIVEIAALDEDVLLTWTTVGGKKYAVQTVAGDYTNNFIEFEPVLIAPGTGESTFSVIHLGGATNMPGRYYRIRLVL